MVLAPNFARVEASLEAALAALPLEGANGVPADLRREYATLSLYLLQTSERLALLAAVWRAGGHPVVDDEPVAFECAQSATAKHGLA
jgi:hypothetical protein